MNRGVALTTIIYSVAGFLGVSVFGFAVTFASSTTEKVNQNTEDIVKLKNSTCVQNSNIENIATAVHASFVPDPNCK